MESTDTFSAGQPYPGYPGIERVTPAHMCNRFGFWFLFREENGRAAMMKALQNAVLANAQLRGWQLIDEIDVSDEAADKLLLGILEGSDAVEKVIRGDEGFGG